MATRPSQGDTTSAATEILLSLVPRSRHELIDVRRRLATEAGDVLRRYSRALYCSVHTTAGYLEQSLTRRLDERDERVDQFLGAFRALFPEGAGYRHDAIDERADLTDAQRVVEPRNADSHLTFIGAGLRNVVTRRNTGEAPVHFIELDGVHEGGRRVRTTRVIAYDEEEIVERLSLAVPVSRHPVDSINLADPKLGLLDAIAGRLARSGLEKGRVDLLLAPQERGAGLTVNEYETFLMSHDLAEVLRNPLKFAALRSKHMLEDPRAIPDKTLDYAKYDLVHVFNSLMEAFGLSESSVERLLAKLIGKPAERFLRMKRGVSFAASDAPGCARAQLVRGTYQSPILVQWRPAEGQTRRLDVVVRRFR